MRSDGMPSFPGTLLQAKLSKFVNSRFSIQQLHDEERFYNIEGWGGNSILSGVKSLQLFVITSLLLDLRGTVLPCVGTRPFLIPSNDSKTVIALWFIQLLTENHVLGQTKQVKMGL